MISLGTAPLTFDVGQYEYTPENITKILSETVDASDCRYMIKCASGMSSQIGQIWKLSNGKWIELEKLDWPTDMTKEPFCHRIRWGSVGNNEIQINVSNGKVQGVYKYTGGELKEVAVKTIT
jgi:hypothetical protein